MYLSHLLDPTFPPRTMDHLFPGVLHVDGREGECSVGEMSTRIRLDWYPRAWDVLDRRSGPERFASMWLVGADDLVRRLPIRRDDFWWHDEDAVAATWHGARGEVWAGSLLRVDREPSPVGLSGWLAHEVWLIGDWSITVPPELWEQMQQGATVGA
jgi:hypothetical protein